LEHLAKALKKRKHLDVHKPSTEDSDDETIFDVAAAMKAKGGLTGIEAKRALLPPGEQLLTACREKRAADALRRRA
jgi:hypothetical protein